LLESVFLLHFHLLHICASFHSSLFWFVSQLQILFFYDLLFYFIFNFCYCGSGGTLWHLQIFFLQLIIVEFTPPPSPHSWNSFNRSQFSIYIYVYRIFPPYSPSYPVCFAWHPKGRDRKSDGYCLWITLSNWIMCFTYF
jgi:hypothetical protein